MPNFLMERTDSGGISVKQQRDEFQKNQKIAGIGVEGELKNGQVLVYNDDENAWKVDTIKKQFVSSGDFEYAQNLTGRVTKNADFDSNFVTWSYGRIKHTKIGPEGTSLFVLATTDLGGKLIEFELETPYDVSSLVEPPKRIVDEKIQENIQFTRPKTFQFSKNGKKLIITAGRTTEEGVLQSYTLSDPYDIGTIEFEKEIAVAEETEDEYDVVNRVINFVNDGTTLYLSGGTGELGDPDIPRIKKFSLSDPYDIGTISFEEAIDFSDDVNTSIEKDAFLNSLAFLEDGKKAIIIADGPNEDGLQYQKMVSYSLSTSYDLSTKTAENELTKLSESVGLDERIINEGEYRYIDSGVSLDVSPDGSTLILGDPNMYRVDPIGSVIWELSFGEKNDITTLSFNNGEFDFEGPLVDPFWTVGITVKFGPDGENLYLLSKGGYQRITEYKLSEPYDVSTAELTENRSAALESQISESYNIEFKPDGSKLLVNDASFIYEYELTTPWDINTLSFTGNKFELPSGFHNKMAVIDEGNKMTTAAGYYDVTIYEYEFSTAWDVTSMNYTENTYDGFKGARVKSSAFSEDGMHMYLGRISYPGTGTESYVDKYDLYEPFDISNAKFDQSIDVTNRTYQIESLELVDSGSSFTICGWEGVVSKFDVGDKAVLESLQYTDDRVNSLVDTGTNVTKTYDDDNRSLQIESETKIQSRTTVSSDSNTSGDQVYYSIDTSGGAVTLTIRTAEAEDGRIVKVKRNGGNVVTIATEGSAKIDGSDTLELTSDNESLELVYNSDTDGWEVF